MARLLSGMKKFILGKAGNSLVLRFVYIMALIFEEQFSREPIMPIYEYQCVNCLHELEKLQKISDDPLIDCPECNEASLKKLVSAAAFRLKGGGWYETDFKTGKKKNVTASANEKAGGNEKSDSSSKSSGDVSKADAPKKKSDSSSATANKT